ncbi:hypothetical protein BC628DRAFT_1422400 [Trametes gibbosa]|nr:hypothetical protein BC628DRAFT_1422400 [Trametes gibbosa]
MRPFQAAVDTVMYAMLIFLISSTTLGACAAALPAEPAADALVPHEDLKWL